MKNFYTCLLLMIVSLSAFTQTNGVLVKGYVTYANGLAAANKAVTISTDTIATNACSQTHVRYTNANGFYIDTLKCPTTNITRIRVYTANCTNGTAIVHELQVPASNEIESNFNLSCNPAPVNCEAAFFFTNGNMPANFIFNSSNAHGVSATDTIIRRRWRFGDGDTLGGNVINTTHSYTQPGTYQVCLTIWTASGCENTVCKTVALTSTGCDAIFRDSVAGNKAFFFSNASHAITGDSIVNRVWNFGDGSGIAFGNVINPDHVYQQAGVYSVCLRIVSRYGCIDSTCRQITVSTPPPPACNTSFTFAPATSNHKEILFNSSASTAGNNDNIISRTWHFGDGSTLSGNIISPSHVYAADGAYNVCLRMVTALGCIKEVCKMVYISSPHCEAQFNFGGMPATSAGYPIKFNSSTAHGAVGDTIRERIWKFGDGATVGGNVVDPLHVYTTTGTYSVCLVIVTQGGCRDTACISIQLPLQGQSYCNPAFTFTPSATNNVQFNSSGSSTAGGDSIVSRTWNFGDGSNVNGNIVNPQHQYAQPGIYNVCLRIISARGCEKTLCKQVVSATAASNCIPRFEYVRITPKKVQFQSGMSWSAAGDSIIQRKWNFGDGSPIVTGNIVSPVHEYPNLGIYTSCLTITTASGCSNTYCSLVKVLDTAVNNTTTEPIKIVNMYPNPATVQLNTAVWSLHNNVTAELAIYDIYGQKKWSTNKILLQGNNYTVLPVSQLLAGPYFFRVTTMYGVKSRQFYKL
jgi:PKD repeat protein